MEYTKIYRNKFLHNFYTVKTLDKDFNYEQRFELLMSF